MPAGIGRKIQIRNQYRAGNVFPLEKQDCRILSALLSCSDTLPGSLPAGGETMLRMKKGAEPKESLRPGTEQRD